MLTTAIITHHAGDYVSDNDIQRGWKPGGGRRYVSKEGNTYHTQPNVY